MDYRELLKKLLVGLECTTQDYSAIGHARLMGYLTDTEHAELQRLESEAMAERAS